MMIASGPRICLFSFKSKKCNATVTQLLPLAGTEQVKCCVVDNFILQVWGKYALNACLSVGLHAIYSKVVGPFGHCEGIIVLVLFNF